MAEYVVIGLGIFGRSIASELQQLGNEVMGVDIDRDIVQDLSDTLRQTIQADATSEAAVHELGLASVDAAIVAIGSPEDSIMITLILKKMGVAWIVAKASNDLHGEILQLVGADRVVFPEKEAAVRLAHGMSVPEIQDYLSINRNTGIIKLTVTQNLVGRTYSEIVNASNEVRLIGLIRKDRVLFGSMVGERLQERDVLILAGRDEDLRNLAHLTE